MSSQPKPPFPDQSQSMPGSSDEMSPPPDYGEDSYRGNGRLRDKKALITGADSGIGRAVALAFAREDAAHCRSLIERAVEAFGRIDILVNNAAHQASFDSLEDIGDEEWDITLRTNLHSMFYLSKAAVPHMPDGGAIINTTSINADTPSPQLLAYATSKGAIHNFTGGLAQLLAPKGIRVNCVAPGPIGTPQGDRRSTASILTA